MYRKLGKQKNLRSDLWIHEINSAEVKKVAPKMRETLAGGEKYNRRSYEKMINFMIFRLSKYVIF